MEIIKRLMEVDPEKVAWVDQHGDVHLELPSVLLELGMENTQENRDLIRKEFQELLQGLGKKVQHMEYCPSCGVRDFETHAADCGWRGKPINA